MQKQNIEEYLSLRREIDSIKKCVTDYLGFLILGIGAAFSVWGTIGVTTDKTYALLPIGYSSLAISMIAVFMLFILIYKFISHNRYVGYCILLTQEVWDQRSNKQQTDSLILWELCVNQLRKREIIASAKMLEEDIIFNEQNNVVDIEPKVSTITAGLWFFFKALFRVQKSYSWGFPLTIVRIFTVVVWSCVSFGIYALYPTIQAGYYNDWSGEAALALGFLLLVVVSQFVLWLNIASRIHGLMVGFDTVTSFSKKFRPVREQALQEIYGITATWKELTSPFSQNSNQDKSVNKPWKLWILFRK